MRYRFLLSLSSIRAIKVEASLSDENLIKFYHFGYLEKIKISFLNCGSVRLYIIHPSGGFHLKKWFATLSFSTCCATISSKVTKVMMMIPLHMICICNADFLILRMVALNCNLCYIVYCIKHSNYRKFLPFLSKVQDDQKRITLFTKEY